DDVVADLDALVADEDRRAGDELPDVVLVLVAEGAPQDFSFPGLFHHVNFSPSRWRPACGSGRPARRCAGGSPYPLRTLADDIVNNTVFLALIGRHDVVPLGIILDTFDRLTRVVHQDFIDALAHPQDFSGRNIYIGRLAPQPRHQRLVDDDAGIRQG